MRNLINKSGLRIEELDGLRGLAVSMVLIWHFVGCMIDQSLGNWAKVVFDITIFGRTGVDLFFVLSGFLITGIVLDRSSHAKIFLQSFYIRRVFRIVPSYLILVSIYWLIVAAGKNNYAFNTETPLLYHATFTQNWWMSANEKWGPAAISVTWSVAIEEQFYLFFPIFLLIASQKNLPKIFVAIAIFSICFRLVAIFIFDNPFLMYVNTLSRLDGLAAGALVAYLWRDPRFGVWLSSFSYIKKVFWVLLSLVPLFLIALHSNRTMTMALWGHTYLTLLYAVSLLAILISLPSGGMYFLRRTWLRKIGAVSYTIYLFHPFFLSSIFLLAGRSERISTLWDCGLAGAALLVTFFYSKVSFKYLEQPLTRLGRAFRY